MKKKLRSFLGVMLISIGVFLISITIVMKYDAYKKQNELLEEFNNITVEIEENNDIDEEYNYYDSNVEINDVIGVVSVPKINVRVGLVEGVGEEQIKYGVGHFPGTSMPGRKGNFAIAGHRTYYYGQPFQDIDKLKVGDEIIVESTENKYVYEVTENYIVEPEEVSVLDESEEATITIVTCTLDGKRRVIIKGTLK